MRIRIFAALALVAAMRCAAAATGDDGGMQARRLLTEHKCYLCHADFEAKAGPAYVDVAAHFRGTSGAEALIASQIRNGIRGGGPWHMPPHPEVSAGEARTIARYILSLDPRAAPKSP